MRKNQIWIGDEKVGYALCEERRPPGYRVHVRKIGIPTHRDMTAIRWQIVVITPDGTEVPLRRAQRTSAAARRVAALAIADQEYFELLVKAQKEALDGSK